MDRKRRTGYYSIVRYIPNVYNGEIFNVGLILHLENGDLLSEFINKEHSKLKSLSNNERSNYGYFRDKLSYYFENISDLFGDVGDVAVSSPADPKFLEEIKNHFTNENFMFTTSKPLMSRDMDKSFLNIFKQYVGSLEERTVETNTKNKVSEIFEERKYLGTKVKKNHSIRPFKALVDTTMKIDFIYKNGVWNYIQVVPSLKQNKNRLDFIAEVQLLFQSIKLEDKVKFIYNGDDPETKEMIKYLINERDNIEKINLEKKDSINELLLDIEINAKDGIEDLLAAV